MPTLGCHGWGSQGGVNLAQGHWDAMAGSKAPGQQPRVLPPAKEECIWLKGHWDANWVIGAGPLPRFCRQCNCAGWSRGQEGFSTPATNGLGGHSRRRRPSGCAGWSQLGNLCGLVSTGQQNPRNPRNPRGPRGRDGKEGWRVGLHRGQLCRPQVVGSSPQSSSALSLPAFCNGGVWFGGLHGSHVG